MRTRSIFNALKSLRFYYFLVSSIEAIKNRTPNYDKSHKNMI